MKFFKRREFECSCGCGFNTVDFELSEVMDDVREYFGEEVTITSGCRCIKHNKLEGGADSSKHIIGQACDFKVKNVHADVVADYLEKKYPNKYGIGRYNGRTHIDVRLSKARWDMR